MPAIELKKAIETNTVDDSVYHKGVVAVLVAGNLDIEINIRLDEKNEEVTLLEYFCCVRIDGEWESYNDVFDEVNLDAADFEAEMFRVLSKYAEEEGLFFFTENKSYSDRHYLQSADISEGIEM